MTKHNEKKLFSKDSKEEKPLEGAINAARIVENPGKIDLLPGR